MTPLLLALALAVNGAAAAPAPGQGGSLAVRELAPGIPDPGPLPECAALAKDDTQEARDRATGCEVRARRLQVVMEDHWLQQAKGIITGQGTALVALQTAHRQRATVGGALVMVGTAAVAGGLVALADGHRTAGALVATGGAVVGTVGWVALEW